MAANPIESRPVAAPSPNDRAIRSVRGIADPRSVEAIELPDHTPPESTDPRWVRFLAFLDPLEARIVAGRLEVEGVPAVVLESPGFDLGSVAAILVPKVLLHRARWVLAWPEPSDEELLLLATGEIGTASESTP